MARRLILMALGLLLSAPLAAVGPAAALPAGFADALVANVASPTALAFTPDGRLLIASQTGQLRVYQNGALLPDPALDLRAPNLACVNHERGLLGLAADPNFAGNHYIYLYYTFNKYPSTDPALNCPDVQPTNPNNPVNRVSRFTLPDSNSIDLASEFVLIDNMPSTRGNHNAGDLHFDQAGNLYASVGDGGADYTRTHGQAGGNKAAQDPFILLGKVMRIRPDGTLPADNPWLGADSARCYDPAPSGNKAAINADGKKCQETYAWGLRNPFRFAIDPNAVNPRVFVNDVGENTWEEIDDAQPGANYGWSIREGHCAQGSATDCGAPPAGMTNPIYDYQHGAPNNCTAITGGAFVPNGTWPAYAGAYLFGDYGCGQIFTLAPDGAGGYTPGVFATGVGAIISMSFGPYGATKALYYTTFSTGGQLRRISLSDANQPPSAVAAASPSSGPAPLTVGFSAAGSSDPEGDPLIYDWDFGDGSAHASAATATHTYALGTFTATLRVSDNHGNSDTATIRIDAGNTAPAPSIDAPAASLRFHVGEQITLQGHATDAEDGQLPAGSLSWRAVLHHNDHTHPYIPPTPGASLTLTAPSPEDLAATGTSYLEVFLTATDSQGLTSVITRELRPNLVDVTLATVPAGLALTVNATSITAPRTLVSWEGYALDVDAQDQANAGQNFLLDRWSDGGAAAHTIATPGQAATYTAQFRAGRAVNKVYLSMVVR
jgi:glucose/arabinose dehydrogenase